MLDSDWLQGVHYLLIYGHLPSSSSQIVSSPLSINALAGASYQPVSKMSNHSNGNAVKADGLEYLPYPSRS